MRALRQAADALPVGRNLLRWRRLDVQEMPMTVSHNDRCASLLGQGCDCRSPWATDTAELGRRGSILDLPMREPWFRDAVMTAQAAHADDVLGWAERVAAVYGKSGTLEVAAVICSLIDLVNAVACEGHDG